LCAAWVIRRCVCMCVCLSRRLALNCELRTYRWTIWRLCQTWCRLIIRPSTGNILPFVIRVAVITSAVVTEIICGDFIVQRHVSGDLVMMIGCWEKHMKNTWTYKGLYCTCSSIYFQLTQFTGPWFDLYWIVSECYFIWTWMLLHYLVKLQCFKNRINSKIHYQRTFWSIFADVSA